MSVYDTSNSTPGAHIPQNSPKGPSGKALWAVASVLTLLTVGATAFGVTAIKNDTDNLAASPSAPSTTAATTTIAAPPPTSAEPVTVTVIVTVPVTVPVTIPTPVTETIPVYVPPPTATPTVSRDEAEYAVDRAIAEFIENDNAENASAVVSLYSSPVNYEGQSVSRSWLFGDLEEGWNNFPDHHLDYSSSANFITGPTFDGSGWSGTVRFSFRFTGTGASSGEYVCRDHVATDRVYVDASGDVTVSSHSTESTDC